MLKISYLCIMKNMRRLFIFSLLFITIDLFADSDVNSYYREGKILWQQHNDYAAAMKLFLKAIHEPCDDYVLIGRVYSNMGTICRKGERHDLAYNMYARSADYFSRADSMARYAYALNNMAMEKAISGDKEMCDSLLCLAEKASPDSMVRIKLLETRAEASLQVKQYDSAIYYAKQLYACGNHESTGLLTCAQAFTYLQLYDSAVCYAHRVMETTKSIKDRNNALYILTQFDNNVPLQKTRDWAAERADIQKELAQQHGDLILSIQLLEQDLIRNTTIRKKWWLWGCLCLILIVGLAIGVYYIYSYLRQRRTQNIEQRRLQVEEQCLALKNTPDLIQALQWKDYSRFCQIVNQSFWGLSNKLQCQKQLSEREVRMCILVLLNVSTYTIADMLPYAENSVGTLKDRTAKKLGTTGRNLRSWLINMAIGQKMDDKEETDIHVLSDE